MITLQILLAWLVIKIIEATLKTIAEKRQQK